MSIYKMSIAFSYWKNDKLYVIGLLNVMKLVEEGGDEMYRDYIFSCVRPFYERTVSDLDP
jgi:hypothetical protein